VAEIREDISGIKSNLGALSQWVTTTESKLNKAESALAEYGERLDRIEEDLEYQSSYSRDLWDRVQDLENRCRRNNIRVLGVPEGAEGNNISGPAFLLTLLHDCLPFPDAGDMEIERSHRTLGQKPGPDQHPRPIIARFLRFRDQENILRLAREAGELRWKGEKIMIFPDMSRELAMQCRHFTLARRCCMALGLQYALQYPAMLRVTIDGRLQSFTDPEEALWELNSLRDQNEEGMDQRCPQPQQERRVARSLVPPPVLPQPPFSSCPDW
uniref:L1 transposable element RRM domain-containing protein n=1 Tax=Latimeria chalumnae TaxID=7897 RepID=H3B1W3_LATCH